MSLLRAARTTVFVPNRTEGFYLPALEGMAAGTLVVCPDCVGNRTFCLPGHNSFRPGYSVDDIASAAEAALALPPDGVQRYLANAAETVGGYGLARERRAFMQILDDVERLWNV